MLKHGILGLLNYGEMTGYEIKEAFQNSLNFFWQAQTSQIYRELHTLQEKQWILMRTVAQSGKPDKHVCSITEAGRQELRRWLQEPSGNGITRSPVLMKLFFMGELPISDALEYLKQLRENQCSDIDALRQTDASIAFYQRLISGKHAPLFWQMTADFGKRYSQMYLEWIDSCIQLLEHSEEQS